MLDLRLLHYFVTAAELEHIGRAAERLHISQSPLSRQIRLLENQLQLELFVRERQRIRLTESGKWLLNEAQKLLGQAEKIRNEAEQRALGKTGTISVGFVSKAMWSGIVRNVFRRFQTDFPDAVLQLSNLRSTAQMEAIDAGRLDAGFVSIPTTSRTLECACVSEEPFVLAVPAAHPLSSQRAITPRDLDGVRWILLSPLMSAKTRVRFLAACSEAGFAPHIAQEVTEPNTLLTLVESGFGVGLIDRGARKYASSSLAFRALPWLPLRSRLYLICSMHGRSPLVNSFQSYVHTIGPTS